MAILTGILQFVLVLVCIMLVGVILLQRNKGAGAGVTFGGGEAVFGADMGNVLTRTTIVLGFLFVVITIALSIINARIRTAGAGSVTDGLAPAAPIQTPIPAADEATLPEASADEAAAAAETATEAAAEVATEATETAAEVASEAVEAATDSAATVAEAVEEGAKSAVVTDVNAAEAEVPAAESSSAEEPATSVDTTGAAAAE